LKRKLSSEIGEDVLCSFGNWNYMGALILRRNLKKGKQKRGDHQVKKKGENPDVLPELLSSVTEEVCVRVENLA
jgi:hypothetical protein